MTTPPPPSYQEARCDPPTPPPPPPPPRFFKKGWWRPSSFLVWFTTLPPPYSAVNAIYTRPLPPPPPRPPKPHSLFSRRVDVIFKYQRYFVLSEARTQRNSWLMRCMYLSLALPVSRFRFKDCNFWLAWNCVSLCNDHCFEGRPFERGKNVNHYPTLMTS